MAKRHTGSRISITIKGMEWLRKQIGADDLAGANAMSTNLEDENTYVLVERNVPAPLTGLKPGEIVTSLEWNGLPAKWMNGNMYVRRDFYEQSQ
jgi:hypothetical protein